jgi:hypothetical protein
MMLSLFLLLASPASAGSGPWTLSGGDVSAYVGTEYERFGHLASSTGSYAPEVVPVDNGVETVGAQLIVGYGVRDRIDVELQIPYLQVAANRDDGPLCTTIGLDGCDSTRGFGALTAVVKGLVVDELAGPPVSVAVGAELRLGLNTAATRARVTNLGEGTTDVGPFVAIGRSGALGKGYWSGYLTGGWRYRFPNTEVGDRPVPGSEIHADLEWLGGARPWWSIGPAVSLLWRPEGVDIEALDFGDTDRFGELRVFNLLAGGKLIIRSSQHTSLALGVLGTTYAVNNPTDKIIVSAGLSGQLPTRRRERE